MDQSNKKIVTLSFLIFGAISAYIISSIIKILEASISFFASLSGNEFFTHGFPVAVGILVFAYLQINKKTNKWGEEIVIEIRKMVWRTGKDTVAVTVAVCIMVLISGVVLGLLDYLSSKLINYLISL